VTQSQKERERDERTRTPETEGEVGGGGGEGGGGGGGGGGGEEKRGERCRVRTAPRVGGERVKCHQSIQDGVNSLLRAHGSFGRYQKITEAAQPGKARRSGAGGVRAWE